LNENLSDEIAQRLRMNGVDAVSSHETGMDTQDDDAQMQFAVSQGRAIVTINKRDFVRNQCQVQGKWLGASWGNCEQ
jgi:predicted nuclease of predicted toxin-antitoxin system